MDVLVPKGSRNTGRVVRRSCKGIFEDDSVGEEIVRRIQRADDLLSRLDECLASFDFERAEALIPDIVESGGGNVDALCIKLQDAHDEYVKQAREKIADDIANSLPQMESVCGRMEGNGVRKAVLEWLPPPNSKADSYCLIRKKDSEPTSATDGTVVYRGTLRSFDDTTIPIGIPCHYAVFSCYDGRVNPTPNVLRTSLVYAPQIESFEVRMGGYSCCAIANLSWKLPTYDVGARIALLLEKISGNERVKIDLTEGQEQYLDTEITVEEPYRYELTLIVSGMSLSPIVREGHVPRLPELPTVPASCYYQEGRHWLRVEWPEGVSEICLTDGRGRSVHYTKEDYDKRRVAIPQTFAEAELEVQAIRRFGPTKMAFGPKRKVRFTDSRSTLQVSIEHGPGGAFSFFKWRQNVSWGLKIDFGGGIPPQVMQVSVENEGEKRVFTIPGEQIKQNEFMPFPAHWGVKSGAIIDVFPSDGSSVTYLTSQKIP